MMSTILQMKKRRHREAKYLAQDNTVRWWQGRGLNPGACSGCRGQVLNSPVTEASPN